MHDRDQTLSDPMYSTNEQSKCDSPNKIYDILNKISTNQAKFNTMMSQFNRTRNQIIGYTDDLNQTFSQQLPKVKMELSYAPVDHIQQQDFKSISNPPSRRLMSQQQIDLKTPSKKQSIKMLINKMDSKQPTGIIHRIKDKDQNIRIKRLNTGERLKTKERQRKSRKQSRKIQEPDYNKQVLEQQTNNLTNKTRQPSQLVLNYKLQKLVPDQGLPKVVIEKPKQQNKQQQTRSPAKRIQKLSPKRLERINEKSEQAVQATVSVDRSEKRKSLISSNLLLIRKYIKQNKQLSQNSTTDEVYQYFHTLCEKIKIQLEYPLIKRFKNCIYYGENPNRSTASQLCQGFMYHYQVKLYCGQFRNQKKHGRGCQISFKEDIICKGLFDSGEKIGSFKITKIGDYQYEGELRDGLFEGNGILINQESRYEGQFKRGLKHGKGHQIFINTKFNYIGDFSEGDFNGFGEYSNQNYFYQGGFKNSLKEGQGYQKTLNDQYKGSFIKGKREGKGILYFPNGDLYNGQFKDGQMNGHGQLKYANSKSVNGIFKNGRIVEQIRTHDVSKNMITPKSRQKDYEESGHLPRFENKIASNLEKSTYYRDKILNSKKIKLQEDGLSLSMNRKYSIKQKQASSPIDTFKQPTVTKPIQIKTYNKNLQYYTPNVPKSNNPNLQIDYSSFNMEDEMPAFPIIKLNMERRRKKN